MTQQRTDCDPYCMAPFGSHHPRCPGAPERCEHEWQSFGGPGLDPWRECWLCGKKEEDS